MVLLWGFRQKLSSIENKEVAMEKKYKSKIDIAVLILFFCRVEQFAQVFASVKTARPSKLYLYQDGARNEKDMSGILACREIAEKIDWECEVHYLYQDKNYGCDPSEYMAQKWFFGQEEMGIVLEDDDVPTQSFFPFCKELLERYRYDDRIHMICGMNNYDVAKDVKESYLFSDYGSIWGWAGWRRVIDTWDADYLWLENSEKRNHIKKHFASSYAWKIFIKTAEQHKRSGKEYYETINGASHHLYDRLNIVPKYNMIRNVGINSEGTHSTNNEKLLGKEAHRLQNLNVYEMEFPLKHPTVIERNKRFDKKFEAQFSLGARLMNLCERVYRTLRYREIRESIDIIKGKIKRADKL